MSLFDKVFCVIFKLMIKILRLLRFGGTSLPGKLALKLSPGLLKRISFGQRVVVITGTNGKTTTSRIIANILIHNKKSFFTNKSGANLLSGITTTFIENSNQKTDYVILESDEAAFYVLTNHITPEFVIVTNFFRDQLDRYGELYGTLEKVKNGISFVPSAHLILNADDSLCASIGKEIDNAVTYYGIHESAYSAITEPEASDSVYCIYCRSKYDYSSRTIGHLGSYHCSECGYKRPHLDVYAKNINMDSDNHSFAEIVLGSKTYSAKIALPAIYNVYNALASAAFSKAAGLDTINSLDALSDFEFGFGRMEKIKVKDKYINIMLVKNPTGFNSTLDYLIQLDARYTLCFVINDNIADGRDVSWLWDVNFEKILGFASDKVSKIICSGIRAYDMALRLKYFDYPKDKLLIEENYFDLIETGLKNTAPKGTLYILPTYTAMLKIRLILQKKYGLKEFWK